MTITTNIGTFRHRVEIQESTRTRGEQGTQIDAFSKIATRWASIVEREDEKFIVDMRYYPGLIPTNKKLLDEDGAKISVNRLKHGTRILNIIDVLDMRAMKQIVRCVCIRDDQTF